MHNVHQLQTEMTDPHRGAKNLLQDVPFDEDLLEDISSVTIRNFIPCTHGQDADECEHKDCYDPDRKVTISLSFKYNTSMRSKKECTILFETTLQAMIDTITMTDDCGETDATKCEGNMFSSDYEYFWCKKHLGKYNEFKLSQIIVNSDFDVGFVPLTMMKLGDKSLTMKEITFEEI